MRIGQARERARQWVIEEASAIPGFCGAYTAGSTNWLPEDASLTTTSDFDIMVILTDPNQARARHKFRYRDVLLEASYLGSDQLHSSDFVLSNYHLAPSFRTATILLDPSTHLAALHGTVSRDYAKRQWVRRRCANARDKVVNNLQSIDEAAPLHDQVIACLFAAGINTHILLAAGLRNPTVRQRYVAARELLADYDLLEFHETLLELLGASRISRERVRGHLATLADIFGATANIIKTPFPFSSDLSTIARPIAIDGSRELIDRGYHREAMFWIAVTHSRCHKVLSAGAPGELPQEFSKTYRDLLNDLGMVSLARVRRRCAEIEHALPQVWEIAEKVISSNQQIDDG